MREVTSEGARRGDDVATENEGGGGCGSGSGCACFRTGRSGAGGCSWRLFAHRKGSASRTRLGRRSGGSDSVSSSHGTSASTTRAGVP